MFLFRLLINNRVISSRTRTHRKMIRGYPRLHRQCGSCKSITGLITARKSNNRETNLPGDYALTDNRDREGPDTRQKTLAKFPSDSRVGQAYQGVWTFNREDLCSGEKLKPWLSRILRVALVDLLLNRYSILKYRVHLV